MKLEILDEDVKPLWEFLVQALKDDPQRQHAELGRWLANQIKNRASGNIGKMRAGCDMGNRAIDLYLKMKEGPPTHGDCEAD